MKTYFYSEDGVGALLGKINPLLKMYDLEIKTTPTNDGWVAELEYQSICSSKENLSEDALFRIGLVRICEALHMSRSGASDPLREKEEIAMVDYLRKRLDNWKTNVDSSSFQYDEAVRNLVICTLKEKNHHNRRKL